MSQKLKLMLGSYARGLIAAVSTVLFFTLFASFNMGLDKFLEDVSTTTGLKALASVALGAFFKFTWDFIRKSNPAFGNGSIPEPDNNPALPVESMNGPQEIDPAQDADQLALDEGTDNDNG